METRTAADRHFASASQPSLEPLQVRKSATRIRFVCTLGSEGVRSRSAVLERLRDSATRVVGSCDSWGKRGEAADRLGLNKATWTFISWSCKCSALNSRFMRQRLPMLDAAVIDFYSDHHVEPEHCKGVCGDTRKKFTYDQSDTVEWALQCPS